MNISSTLQTIQWNFETLHHSEKPKVVRLIAGEELKAEGKCLPYFGTGTNNGFFEIVEDSKNRDWAVFTLGRQKKNN